MCCQVLVDHIFGCHIMSNQHKLVQMILGVQCALHLPCPESESVSTLTTVHGNHEVTEWHLRTETTQDHTFHEFQVSLQVSNKYFIFKFWVFNRVVSTTYVRSITLQLTWMSADASCLHVTTIHFADVRHEIWWPHQMLQRQTIKR